MRLILITGKGGVGKTTMAAASAALTAGQGQKVLLVSTDRAHSLADALDTPLGSEPVEIDAGLSALQVDTQASFQQSWAVLRRYLVDLLGSGGVDAMAAEELTVLPGAEEILALLAVRDQAASGRWDVVIVDCAPTAETLRLLALPRALSWYMERILPTHRRMVRGLGPLLGGVTLPGDGVTEAVTQLHAELLGVQALLDDHGTSVRLVLTAEAVVLAEARRTATSLVLFGHRLDSVIVNRLIPGGGDAWREAWAAAQAAQLTEVEASFPGLPVRRAAYLAAEPVGLPALAAIGADLYRNGDPLAPPPPSVALDVRRTPDQDGERFELFLPLPHAEREAVQLARSGDELVLTVGGYRRLLALPGVLRRCRVTGSDLAGGRLRVVFRPDPDLWPTS
ncbi:MAG: ArsA family ATPase [Geodermatophilaceae bacterium]|nr:ArsA family ATPase [Geodermatophilaceae bacterium]MDQ3464756.1 ArsA family ATPase [Actinomycetota bacterium]